MSIKIKTLLAISLILITFLCFDNSQIQTTPDVKFWASSHLILHGIMVFLNYRRFKVQYVPFIFFVSVINFFTWGVSPHFVNVFNFQLGTLNSKALEWSFYGYLVFYFSFQAFSNFQKKADTSNINNTERFEGQDWLKKFNSFKYVLLFLYFLVQIVSLPISNLDGIIVYYTCAIFLIGYYLKVNKFIDSAVLVAILLLESYNNISSGLVYPLMYFYFFLFFVSLNFYKNTWVNNVITFFSAAIIIVFTMLFTSVKAEYRAQNRYEYTVNERANLFRTLIATKYSNENNIQEVKNPESGIIWRLSYPISALSLVLEKTPLLVPFWNGESYVTLLYKFIPRFIWPDKPSEQMGQTFGHRYNILRRDDLHTAMNTPILTEAYMNFSFVGILFVMFFMSYIIASIYFKENQKRNYTDVSVSFILKILKLAYLGTIFLQWESNFSLMIGKIIILIICDYGLVKLFLINREPK